MPLLSSFVCNDGYFQTVLGNDLPFRPRVTQVHGSMEGKDVLKLVETINNTKEQQAKEKEER